VSDLLVLRVLTRPNLGGPVRQAIALWHPHGAMGVRTLLVTGRCGSDEPAVRPDEHGVPALSYAAALAAGRDAAGWVELADLQRGVAPFADRRAAAALRELITRCRPDVVHTHTSKAGWLGRRAARGVPGVVTAHTFHGHVLRDYFGGLASHLLGRLERNLARATDLLFAVSASCADELAALGIAARERFTVAPPAVTAAPPGDRASARRQLGLGDEFVAVCIGRLVPVKRVEHFIAAVELVPGCRGHVFGAGPLAPALRRRCAATGGRVVLRGADPEVRRLLPAYDALVVPSRREGCPLVAVEAFLAAVPVVGYDVPGVRDVLAGFGRGLQVAETAGAAGLAAALQRLAAEPGLRAELVAAGRAAAATFAPEKLAATLLEAYRGAMVP
jgi:glycosyltransferase involved in cell wall biosynthesis